MEDIETPGVVSGNTFRLPGTGMIKKRSGRKIIPALIILSFIIIPLVFIGILTNSRINNTIYRETYVETANIPITNETITLNLDISNVAGSVVINQDTSPGKLFDIRTVVSSNENAADIYSRIQWERTNQNNEYTLKFDASRAFLRNNDQIQFNHEINLARNLIIKKFDISSVSGSISVNLANQTIFSPNISTISGGITSMISSSVISDKITLKAISGSIGVEFKNSVLDIYDLSLETISGGVDMKLLNNTFVNDMDFDVNVNSGNIAIIWKQDVLTTTITSTMEMISGSLDLDLILNNSISTEYNYDPNDTIKSMPASNIGTEGSIKFKFSVVSGSLDVKYSN